MTNTFQIGSKVNTLKGKKVYTITGQDEHGNYTTNSGAKFAGSYLRPIKTNEVAEFFAEAAEIQWEPK